MKECYGCHEVKPLDDFYSAVASKDGHKNLCKICYNLGYTNGQARLRLEALAVLGNRCQGCGITDVRVLTIDHVNGGGRADRKAIGGPRIYYKWVAEHPEPYQALCHNCNHLKRIERNENRRPSSL